MAADTYTGGGVGIAQIGTGNDNNTWGILLNAGLAVIEDAASGQLASSATGGMLDLSGSPPPAAPSQARYNALVFSGTLVSNLTVIVPNLKKSWIVANETGGAFSLLIKTTAGTATQIPQGTEKWVLCDGSNNVLRLDRNMVGEFVDSGRTSVPSGALECDGTAISRTNFPDLYAAVGTTWGVGDGVTTFNLPNLKDTGRFGRSRTNAIAVGTYQSNQNAAHTHTGTTAVDGPDHTHTGTGTSGVESADHTHGILARSTVDAFGANVQATGGNAAVVYDLGTTGAKNSNTGGKSATHTHTTTITTGGVSANHTHTLTTASSGGSEARPEAAVVLSCIRY